MAGRLRASSGPVEVVWRLAPVLAMLALMWLVTAVNLLVLHGAWLASGVRAHDPSASWPLAWAWSRSPRTEVCCGD
jgi:hypothetical protein